jgi:integrase
MAAYQSQKKKLTKRVVDATHPAPDCDVVVWDTDVSEFRLRVRPTGRKVYELRYRPVGNVAQRQVTIGRHGSPWTVETARDQAKAILAKVASGSDPLAPQPQVSTLTMSGLADKYLIEGPSSKPSKRASSWNVDRYNLDHHMKPILGKAQVAALTPFQLENWRQKVSAGATAKRIPSGKKRGVTNIRGGQGASTKALRVVSAMFNWAIERGLMTNNPADRVKKLPDGRRETYLTDDQCSKIWAACLDLEAAGKLTSTQSAYFRLLMLTGARRGEILQLRWSEVDEQRRLLLLPPARHKSGGLTRSKTLHVSAAAAAVLDELAKSKGTSQFVFPALRSGGENRDRSMAPPKAALGRVLKVAGVNHASPHMMRHTFASQVVADGVGLPVLSKLLGHARISTTERYAHLQVDAGADASNAVSNRYALVK